MGKEKSKHPRIEEVEVSRIVAPEDRNHRLIDVNASDIKALAYNIEVNGLMNAISVRERGDGLLEVIAGFRRFAAVNLLGLETVMARIYDVSDNEAYILSASENFMREPLSWTEQAKALKMMVESGTDYKSAAANLGWSESMVRRRAKLLTLTDAWMKTVGTEKFERWTVGHYELIAIYEPEIQAEILETISAAYPNNWTIDTLSQQLSRSSMLIKTAPWNVKDEALVPIAGSCAACQFRTGATPNLFDDEKSKDKVTYGDRCLKKHCWDAKMAAHSKIKIEKLKAKYPDMVLVTDSCDSPSPDIINRHNYDDCQKDAKGARVAYNVDNGQTKHIMLSTAGKTSKAARPKDESGKPVGPTIEERQQNLAGDRAKWMIAEVLKRLDKGDFEFTGSASALMIAFGTESKRNYFKDDGWKTYFKYADPKLPPKESVDNIVRQVIPIIRQRFGFGLNREEANERRGELANVCAIFGIDIHELNEAAEKAVPLPKALAQQIEAEKLKSKKPKDFSPPAVKVKGNIEKPKAKKTVKRATVLSKGGKKAKKR
jgi:ParB/RepB/Spo0J family partition protein